MATHIIAAVVALFWFFLVYVGVGFGNALSGTGLSNQRLAVAVYIPALLVLTLLIVGAIQARKGRPTAAYLLLAIAIGVAHYILLRVGVL